MYKYLAYLIVYLTIMITILVATQVVRIIQNTINLIGNNKIMKKQLEGLDDISNEDLHRKIENEIRLEMILPKLDRVMDKIDYYIDNSISGRDKNDYDVTHCNDCDHWNEDEDACDAHNCSTLLIHECEVRE